MAVTKKIIGRLPVFYGSYYPKEGGWAMKNRVTLFGSEFESKIENNTYAPATYDETTNTVTFNTDYWDVVSNGTDAWLASDKIEALGYYVENPAWIRVLIDADDHILAGIKADGSVEWSVGVPTPVKEYVTEHLAEIMADVTESLATKVDKEDGKSLVDSDFAGGISYVENPEFVAAYFDSEEKILFGVQTDGNFYFGAGVPRQIVNYIDDKFKDVTAEDIKISLESDTTIMQYLNETYGEYVENPEWLEVKIDADGRIIRGTKLDGTTFIGKLFSPEIDNIVHNMNNLDYYNVTKRNIGTVDITVYSAAGGWEQVAYDSIAYPYDENDTYNVGEVCNVSEDTTHSYKATVRNKGIYPCVEGKETVVAEKLTLETALAAIDSNIKATFMAGQIIVFLDTDNIIEKWELQDDNTWKRVSPYEISDQEGRQEITIDAEEKIISYRKEDGTLVENVGFESPKIATDSLNLSENGMTEFQQALKDAGFNPERAGDWSDYDSQDGDYPLNLDMPKCAMLNIISDYDLTQLSKEGYAANPPYWPAGVEGETYDIPTQVEFFDMQGNYFKKWTKMSGQGNSSMTMVKKNIALDFFDDATMETAFTVRFGDWVPQDSFHIKAFYTDAFRCVSPVACQLYDEMVQHRGVFDDYFWKRALIDFSTITTTSNGSANLKDAEKKLESGARCFPKGFPVIVYQNGEFWGVFSFQLKKHRDNYHQDKENKNHIQLDGTIDANTLFNANGDASLISWIPGNDNGFEVRNPKSSSFVTEAGNQYIDYATISQELAGVNTLDEVVSTYSNGTTYSKGDKCMLNGRMYMSKVNGNAGNNPANASYGSKPKDVFKKATEFWIEITYTNEVKKNVIKLSTYLKKVEDADAVYEASSKTAADVAAFKEVFETLVDPKNLIDYLIIADVTGGISAAKNWQWLTYDGIKWYIGLYDCDNSFGQYFEVTETRRSPNTQHTIRVYFHKYILKYYNTELEAWYKELRDAGIISVKHIIGLIKQWQGAVGAFNMMLEYNKWPDSTRFDSLFRVQKWITAEITNMDAVYHYNN